MLKRYLQPLLKASLASFPVVLVTGARQVGKSTLVQAMSEVGVCGPYHTLDDRTVLDAALTDPDGFVTEIGTPVILDEVQRAPDLLRAVKLVVDRGRRPGMFLLTGSANILTLKKVSETLAGRAAVHELHPFSLAELNGQDQPAVLDALFGCRGPREVLKTLSRGAAGRAKEAHAAGLKDFILSGGFPTPALLGAAAPRGAWFASYRQTYVERDVRELSGIVNLPDFGRLMTTLALRTGSMLNISELSRDIGLPATTLKRYVNILFQTYQVFLVHPYTANPAKRLVKTPKVYAGDTGFACHLSAVGTWETLEKQGRAGAMVETWVATELRKLISLAAEPTRLWYWRTRAGQEVDFLIERGDEVVGIEVKSSAGFQGRDLAGLEACGRALGRRWRLGLLLHRGTEAVPVNAHTVAVPLETLFGAGT